MTDSNLKNALPAGTVLHLYTVKSVLGHGGFGIVYKAHHEVLGFVAIKEYLPAEIAVRESTYVHPLSDNSKGNFDEGLERFVEEAKRLVNFNHPNIIRCRDFFRANGTAYLVMDFEEGLPLSDLLAMREERNSPLTEEEILRVTLPLLEGLKTVHKKGVLHRDIKPGNVFVRRESEQPVLLDFGAAKHNFADFTKSRAPYSPGYAAVEQVEDDGKLGPWTDVHGMGGVLYRIISGSHPPKVESRMLAVQRNRPNPLVPAVELGAGRYSAEFLRAIDKAMELMESDRFQSADELAKALSGGHAGVKPPPEPEPQAIPEPEQQAPTPEPKPEAVREPAPIPIREADAQKSKVVKVLGLLGLAASLVFAVFIFGDFGRSPTPDLSGNGQTPGQTIPSDNTTPPDTDDSSSDGQSSSGGPQFGTSFVAIPAGSFLMGDNTGDGEKRARPTRNVQISGFSLAAQEVSKAQFQQFVSDTGYRTSAETNAGGSSGCHVMDLNGNPKWAFRPNANWTDPGFNQGDNHPVVCVSHNDAIAYINWLNIQTGESFRLPSEAEWEYALRDGSSGSYAFGSTLAASCRAGNVADNTALSNGNVWANRADCLDNVAEGTAERGSFNANSYGLQDMVGNTSEWVEDCWHDSFVNAPSNGNAWLENSDCQYRVLRGSSWNGDPARVAQSAYRSGANNTYRSSKFGFRLARD